MWTFQGSPGRGMGWLGVGEMGEKLGDETSSREQQRAEQSSRLRAWGGKSGLCNILLQIRPITHKPAGKLAKGLHLVTACPVERKLCLTFRCMWARAAERREASRKASCRAREVRIREATEAWPGEHNARLHEEPTETLEWMQDGSWMWASEHSTERQRGPKAGRLETAARCHMAYIILCPIDEAASVFWANKSLVCGSYQHMTVSVTML